MMERSLSQHEEKLNRALILQQLEGDAELLAELVELFLKQAPQLVEAMRKALEEGDMQTLGRSAHSLKGAASNFLAHKTASAAAKLEDDAKTGNMDSAKSRLATLEVLVERLLPELQNLCQGSLK